MIDSKTVVLRKTLTKEDMVKRGMTEAVCKGGGNNKQSAPIQNAKKIETDHDYKPATMTGDLATQISKARVAKGLNQEQLAKLCNITKSTVTAYEKSGSNVVVDSNVLQKISRALGVPLKKPKVKKIDLDAN